MAGHDRYRNTCLIPFTKLPGSSPPIFLVNKAFRLPAVWLSLNSIPRSHRRLRQGDDRDGEMQIRGLLFGAAVVALSATSASATMRISEDRGGQIGHYLDAFATVRTSGERVIVDGNCLSACTLVLGVVPRERICATSRARFGFHAAWMPDRDGRPITSPLGNSGPLEHLPDISPSLDSPARRSVAENDLYAGQRAQRHRGKLRSRHSGSSTISS